MTPLVGWLKPWMMPEILGVDVHPVYMEGAKNTPREYIDEFAAKHQNYGQAVSRKEIAEQKRNEQQKMEVAE
jgi:hypothetical protein